MTTTTGAPPFEVSAEADGPSPTPLAITAPSFSASKKPATEGRSPVAPAHEATGSDDGDDRAGFLGARFWSGVRQPVEQATGMPPQTYADEGFFAAERQQLFERAWTVVGIASEIDQPGRMLVRRLGNKSVLIVRSADGMLRGFLNACRHRGTELAEADCDVSRFIRCPYHRWSYRLDGSLASTPLFEEVPRPGFNRADYPLLPVRVETWGPLLFACCDPDTMPLAEWLGDLPERMAGYGFEHWRVHEERTLEVAANWKLISENFQEYYHLRWVHPELAKVSRVRDHYRYQGPGMYCGQATTPVSGDERDDWLKMPPAAGLDDSDRVSGRFVAVFPNTVLSVLPSHAFLLLLEPVSAGLTRERCVFLLPPSAPLPVDDDDFAATRAFWFEINDEDIDITERAQRGLASTQMPPGPLSPRFEEPLNRFHNMLADVMTSDSLASDRLSVPAGDGPDAASRYGTGVNPSPPRIDRITSILGG